jgi:hypothetical protein
VESSLSCRRLILEVTTPPFTHVLHTAQSWTVPGTYTFISARSHLPLSMHHFSHVSVIKVITIRGGCATMGLSRSSPRVFVQVTVKTQHSRIVVCPPIHNKRPAEVSGSLSRSLDHRGKKKIRPRGAAPPIRQATTRGPLSKQSEKLQSAPAAKGKRATHSAGNISHGNSRDMGIYCGDPQFPFHRLIAAVINGFGLRTPLVMDFYVTVHH